MNMARVTSKDIPANVPVSVIIPCFRCSKTIRRAFSSVIQQTVKPAEIILVDDASDDDTLTVLQDLSDSFAESSVKILKLKKNIGAGSARNAGWDIASQPYVAFLDADDSWHPQKLSIQYEYMKANPQVSIVGHLCGVMRRFPSNDSVRSNFKATRINKFWLLFKNAFSTPTVMLRKELPFRFCSGKRYAEDLLLWQQIAFSDLLIIRLEETLAYVHKARYGQGGLSANLWMMEKGEIDNFLKLHKSEMIGFLLTVAAVSFSIIKFIKRIVVEVFWRLLCRLGVARRHE
jgi:glycosyltransferase involved in cell wall biosynthesis